MFYKISPELHEALETGKLPNKCKIVKNKPGTYLVQLRIFNETNVLIYNYIRVKN
jgi:hypothetical protein